MSRTEAASRVGALSVYLQSESMRARFILIAFRAITGPPLFGLVIHSLWAWFILPLWPRPISYGEAVGLALVLLFVRGVPITEKRPPEERRFTIWNDLLRMVSWWIAILTFWGIAAAYHAVLAVL